jgi:hypothetical protein
MQSSSTSTGGIAGGVGNGTDWFALVNGTTIESYLGQFTSQNGLTSEYDQTTGISNSYALQLNSNYVYIPSCACNAWQQFEYSSVVAGGVFIEYWVYNYFFGCPSPWQQYDATTCHYTSNIVPVPLNQNTYATNLKNLQLEGIANPSSGQDWAILFVKAPNPTAYYNSQPGNRLGLNSWWTQAEFNVFGDMNWTEAIFNSGASLGVNGRLTNSNGTNITPICTQNGNGGVTAETSNFNIAQECLANSGTVGTITFNEHVP